MDGGYPRRNAVLQRRSYTKASSAYQENISSYITTNIISITDGQLYLSPNNFQKNNLPAIDIGKSVSRVGGSAQLKAYKKIASRIALEYPPYWVYCLLLADSGIKIPMIYQLNNSKLANEGRSKFLSSLLTYEKMFDIRR